MAYMTPEPLRRISSERMRNGISTLKARLEVSDRNPDPIEDSVSSGFI